MTKCCKNCEHFSFVIHNHEIWSECEVNDIEGMIVDVFGDWCDDFKMGDGFEKVVEREDRSD